ncbi:MAG TPA: heavy metal-associated domain-containing protein [Thermoplasmata archaeon]|nr:heavy metal-associated domain-containing protein [Thermoplasmata archaeon]
MPRTERVVFAMHGLSCASCAIDVGRALRRMPGIPEANVNYLIDKGTVEFDPEETCWDSIERALERRGYRVMRTRGEVRSIARPIPMSQTLSTLEPTPGRHGLD